VYLNLQDDYGDRRNISIVLVPGVQRQLVNGGFRRNRSRVGS